MMAPSALSLTTNLLRNAAFTIVFSFHSALLFRMNGENCQSTHGVITFSVAQPPVDNAHVPLYYEYLHLLPAVCRPHHHITCLISFLFHFQSMKLAINSWSYHFLSCSTSPVDNTHFQEPPDLLQSASHGNL